MKTKLLFLVLLVAGSIYASPQKEIAEVKKNLNAEKRNVTQLSNKRDNVITSYQIAAKEYVSAKAKQDSLSHKPNSPAYKNAVKQTEKYGKKKDELLNSIEVLKQQIDSVNLLIAGYESTLLKLQNEQKIEKDKNVKDSKAKSKEIVLKKEDKEDKKIARRHQNQVVDSKEALPKNTPSITVPTRTNEQVDDSITKSDSASSNSTSIPWFLYPIFAIIGWFGIRASYRCPHCGKWFTMESAGDTRVREYDSKGKIQRRGVRKRYICSNCGKEKRFISWI